MRQLAKVGRVLARAPIAYLAVQTASGPHVTPVLFAATPDRLWFGVGRGTLKARAIAKHSAVGVVVADGDVSVAIRGQALLLERLPPSLSELARAPFALPVFATRNALEMAAFARDVVGQRAQPPPLAPVSVRPESVDVVEGWTADAVLGWMGADGPVALPARWDAEGSKARVPAGPLRAAGDARRAAACVCVDESDGRGPLAKRGSLVRGVGEARLRGETAVVTLEVQRVTRWEGFETRTVAAS
jgi:Pyridoxamine 5'-phosphate oxidase